MNKDELIKYIKKEYGVNPDYPFEEQFASTAVFRHQDTRKWFGITMKVSGDKFGLEDDFVDVITIKSDPVLIDNIISRDGFYRAYHMNKRQWLSVELSDKVSSEEIKSLIGLSYELTDKKRKK